jgi:hypothetical protein
VRGRRGAREIHPVRQEIRGYGAPLEPRHNEALRLPRGEVCALSALSALSLRTGDFRLSDWGPGTMQSSCFEANLVCLLFSVEAQECWRHTA